MPELGRYARELRARLWKPTVADEVRDELGAHLEQLEQDLIAGGLSPDDARREARRRFGDPTRIATECRTVGEQRDAEFRWRRYRDELWQDVRQALRQLRRAPRYACAAIVTLAVGLGAATTIFSMASAVLFRPLPFDDPHRLLVVNERTPEGGAFSVSEPNYLDWTTRARSFAAWGAWTSRTAVLTGDGSGDPEQLLGVRATHTLFPTLGVAPLLGRGFLPEEDRPGGDTRVALISARLWQRRYGGDAGIVGKRVDIDGVAHRVVGVVPDGKAMPNDIDVWTPLAPSFGNRADRRLEVIARLRDDVTPSRANDEMAAIASELGRIHPLANEGYSASVLPFRQLYVSPQFEQRVLALLATVFLLLAMACINVGNLLLARASTRAREVAVRAALGAGRGRLARQLLTESLVLAIAGATAGVLVATAAVPALRRVAGTSVPRLAELTVDWRVLLFAAAAAVASGLLFGAVPALRLARSRASLDSLRSGTRLAEGGRTRQALIVTSVGLAAVMLVSAALVGRSFLALMRTDLGFDPRGVMIANVTTPTERYNEQRAVVFWRTLLARVREAPGIDAAGAIIEPPFGRLNYAQGFIRAERANPEREGYGMGSWRAVTPGYFETMRIPVIRGRTFTEVDRWDAEVTVVINETLARQAFGAEDPIGRRLASSNGQEKTVIGVVRDTRSLYLDSLPAPTMYWAHEQFPWPSMWIAVRGQGDVIAAVRAQVRALDPLLPVAEVRTLTSLVDDRAAEARLTMLVFTIFAGAALVLAAVGLYGVVAYTVSQRTREIGVALALGAGPSRVVRQVLGDGVRLSLLGAGLGLAVAAQIATLLRAILYETAPTDMATYTSVAVALVAIAALASAGPARRAARLDPVQAMRGE